MLKNVATKNLEKATNSLPDLIFNPPECEDPNRATDEDFKDRKKGQRVPEELKVYLVDQHILRKRSIKDLAKTANLSYDRVNKYVLANKRSPSWKGEQLAKGKEKAEAEVRLAQFVDKVAEDNAPFFSIAEVKSGAE